MRKSSRIWLIAAACLVILGAMIFVGAMFAMHWDFSKLSTCEMQINTYFMEDGFSNISVCAKTADIEFVPAEDASTKIVCREYKNAGYAVAVTDDTLTITFQDDRKWYEHIGVFVSQPKITVYLPAGEYGSLSVKNSTGDVKLPKEFSFADMDISLTTGDVRSCASASGKIRIATSTGLVALEEISAGALELRVTTGTVKITGVRCSGDVKLNVSTGDAHMIDVQCANLHSEGTTGDLRMQDVVVTDKMHLERSTGDVKFTLCDAGELFVKTTTGNVIGSLCSEKIFMAKASTGKVEVPKSVTGGICEIETSTGDIRITIG